MTQQFICLPSKCEDLKISCQHWVGTAAFTMLSKEPADPMSTLVGHSSPYNAS